MAGVSFYNSILSTKKSVLKNVIEDILLEFERQFPFLCFKRKKKKEYENPLEGIMRRNVGCLYSGGFEIQ